MEIERTAIDGVLIIRPRKFEDARGFFAPVFRPDDLEVAGVTHGWVQENQSLSLRKGTIRGLHFQKPPFAQAKLLRVIRGGAFDVSVDLRRASPTYGQHVAIELSAENLAHVYIPPGFAHGFCTLTDNTEVLYKVSAEWSPAHEGGLLWNDPALNITWPVDPSTISLAERDQRWPRLAEIATEFS
jgi:dTDP-4-dehydrorhamnose 3,5-epimerase